MYKLYYNGELNKLKVILKVSVNNWEVIYDDETGEVVEEDDIKFMLIMYSVECEIKTNNNSCTYHH